MAEQSEKNQQAAQEAIGPNKIASPSKTGLDNEVPLQQVPATELEEKYLDGSEADEPAENIPQNNPNRNLDKPDIDKPAYS